MGNDVSNMCSNYDQEAEKQHNEANIQSKQMAPRFPSYERRWIQNRSRSNSPSKYYC